MNIKLHSFKIIFKLYIYSLILPFNLLADIKVIDKKNISYSNAEIVILNMITMNTNIYNIQVGKEFNIPNSLYYIIPITCYKRSLDDMDEDGEDESIMLVNLKMINKDNKRIELNGKWLSSVYTGISDLESGHYDIILKKCYN